MPWTRQQIKAIAAQKERQLGKAGAKRYMHNLKKEAIAKYGYFTKDATKVKRKR